MSFTESDWLYGNNLREMLRIISRKPFGPRSARKFQLFALACCHQVEELLRDARSHHAVAILEKIAEDSISEAERGQVARHARDAFRPELQSWSESEEDTFEEEEIDLTTNSLYCAAAAVWHAIAEVGSPHLIANVDRIWNASPFLREVFDNVVEARAGVAPNQNEARKAIRQEQCDFLRDIIGNPFRPVEFQPEWLLSNNGTVVKMAQWIYEQKEYGDLPILGDALEEAGCGSPGILEHCHSARVHVKGCWALDQILGRE